MKKRINSSTSISRDDFREKLDTESAARLARKRVFISVAIVFVLAFFFSVISYAPRTLTGNFALTDLGMNYAGTNFSAPVDFFNNNATIFSLSNDVFSLTSLNQNITLTANVNIPEGIIFKTGYFWSPALNDWIPFDFGGSSIQGYPWINNSASKSLTIDASRYLGNGYNFIAAYACKRYPHPNGAWKCGCDSPSDTNCAKWMLLIFNATGVNTTSQQNYCTTSLQCNISRKEQCINSRCTFVPECSQDLDCGPENVCIEQICKLPILITNCSTLLNIPGATYRLASNLTQSSQTPCLNVTADDITLDGNGYSILNKIPSSFLGIALTISAQGYDGLIINNLKISRHDGWVSRFGPAIISTIGATNGGSLKLINSNVGSIDTYGGSGNGGNVELINSTVQVIRSYGSSNLGNGGNIMLKDSIAYSINSSGANGGNIVLINSTVTSFIHTPGFGSANAGLGRGGNISFNPCPNLSPQVSVNVSGVNNALNGIVTPSNCRYFTPFVTWTKAKLYYGPEITDLTTSADGSVFYVVSYANAGSQGIQGWLDLYSVNGLDWAQINYESPINYNDVTVLTNARKNFTIYTNYNIFYSNDNGARWVFANSDAMRLVGCDQSPMALPVSSDGMKLACIGNGSQIWISNDGGYNWSVTNSGSKSWIDLKSSEDGNILIATVAQGYPQISKDRGLTWNELKTPILYQWGVSTSYPVVFDMSADGKTIIVGVQADYDSNKGYAKPVHISRDGGATWSYILFFSMSSTYKAPAMSFDGKVIAIGARVYSASGPDTLSISGDNGATWIGSTLPADSSTVIYLAVSGDGSKILAATQDAIYLGTVSYI